MRLKKEQQSREVKKRMCKRQEPLVELNVPVPFLTKESDDETMDITKVKMSDFLVVKLKAGVKTRKFVA